MAKKTWLYRDVPVRVSATADIPLLYRYGARFSDHVQAAINSVDLWIDGSTPTHLIDSSSGLSKMRPMVVPVGGGRVIWGIHKGHHARTVQLSPFVRMSSVPLTYSVTLELAGNNVQPWIVRAYPGSFAPPLPWQISAKDAVGGLDACRTFWSQHAYVYSASLVAAESDQAPAWYRRSLMRQA